MKVKALIKFKDLKSGKAIERNTVFEATEKRIKEINSTSYGKIVEVVEEETNKDE